MYLVFCDGSIVGNTMGLGVFVCEGIYIEQKIKVIDVLYIHKKIKKDICTIDKHHYEFFSIAQALHILKLFEHKKTIVFNDCANTIELLERLKLGNKKNFKHRDLFLSHLTDISQNISFQWLPRKNKGLYIADKLSKANYHYFGDDFIFEKFSQYNTELKKTYFIEQNFSEALKCYHQEI